MGETPDERIAEAIWLLRSKQQPDGTWLLENSHPGRVHFALEEGDGWAEPVEHASGAPRA